MVNFFSFCRPRSIPCVEFVTLTQNVLGQFSRLIKKLLFVILVHKRQTQFVGGGRGQPIVTPVPPLSIFGTGQTPSASQRPGVPAPVLELITATVARMGANPRSHVATSGEEAATISAIIWRPVYLAERPSFFVPSPSNLISCTWWETQVLAAASPLKPSRG